MIFKQQAQSFKPSLSFSPIILSLALKHVIEYLIPSSRDVTPERDRMGRLKDKHHSYSNSKLKHNFDMKTLVELTPKYI